MPNPNPIADQWAPTSARKKIEKMEIHIAWIFKKLQEASRSFNHDPTTQQNHLKLEIDRSARRQKECCTRAFK